MGTKKRTLTTMFLLVGVLMIGIACRVGEDDLPVATQRVDPTAIDPNSLDPIVQRYSGQGTHNEVSVLGDLVLACAVPYTVTASIDDKGNVFIEGVGACISNYSDCSLSTDERCSINAKGFLSEKKEISLSNCNTDLEVIEDRLVVSSTSMSGTFTCSLSGDTTGLTFDLALVK